MRTENSQAHGGRVMMSEILIFAGWQLVTQTILKGGALVPEHCLSKCDSE